MDNGHLLYKYQRKVLFGCEIQSHQLIDAGTGGIIKRVIIKRSHILMSFNVDDRTCASGVSDSGQR